MHAEPPLKTSIVVCGTGIVGLATALALARRGQQVTLLGPRQAFAPATPEVFHPRVYAISPASQRFLESIGVWNMLDAQRSTAVQAMEIHGDGAAHWVQDILRRRGTCGHASCLHGCEKWPDFSVGLGQRGRGESAPT